MEVKRVNLYRDGGSIGATIVLDDGSLTELFLPINLSTRSYESPRLGGHKGRLLTWEEAREFVSGLSYNGPDTDTWGTLTGAIARGEA